MACILIHGPVYLIQFKFRQLEIPPNYNVNHLGCIGGCDEILTQLTEICGTGSRMPARARGPTANHTNPRQPVCLHCQETGHSSNECPSQTRRSRNAQYPGMNQQSGESSVSCSSCGAPCVLRTANTANNRGRKFYSCQSQECNFFVWEDNLNNGSGGRGFTRSNSSTPTPNRGRNGGRGSRGRGRNASNSSNGTFVTATGDPVSGRRCYTCGDPSHFANVCPIVDSDLS